MTHVVTENCIKCKYTDCVAVCPVVCFREADDYLVIDPNECIDCGLCVNECRANAIYSDRNLPNQFVDYINFNKEKAASGLPFISEAKQPLEDADSWNGVSDKGRGYINL